MDLLNGIFRKQKLFEYLNTQNMKTFMKKEKNIQFFKIVPFRDYLVESKEEPISSTQHISSTLLSGIIVNTKFPLSSLNHASKDKHQGEWEVCQFQQRPSMATDPHP